MIPHNSPKPLAHGTYIKDLNRNFLLCESHEIKDEMPPTPEEFVAVVAELHEKSESPTRKFVFHCTTHGGNQPLQNEWCDSWGEFFTRQLCEDVV